MATPTRATRSAVKRGRAFLKLGLDNPEPRRGKCMRTIIIERCVENLHPVFRLKALDLENALRRGIRGITVIINPSVPRVRSFEVREEDGITFLSMINLYPPFKPLKELDVDNFVTYNVAPYFP